MMNKFDFHEIAYIPVHMLYRKRHLDLVILNARSYFYVTRSMPFGSVTPETMQETETAHCSFLIKKIVLI